MDTVWKTKTLKSSADSFEIGCEFQDDLLHGPVTVSYTDKENLESTTNTKT